MRSQPTPSSAAQPASATTSDPQPRGRFRRTVVDHPIAVFLVISILFTWTTMMVSLVAGLDVIPAKLAELVVLLGLAALVTAWTDGRTEVRRLFRGLLRWRLGALYIPILVAMPVLTVLVAAVTGTLDAPEEGWGGIALTYAIFLILGAATANLWEETVWGGFAQGRLMARHGLLLGSLLTAVPVFLIHLPLAFENDGWPGTTWPNALISWGVLLVAAPFQRYLIGTLLLDTGGSTLAAGLMHASINAAGAMAVVSAGWQSVPALVLLTVAVGVYRSVRGRSWSEGYAPALTPASEAAQRTELGARPPTTNCR